MKLIRSLWQLWKTAPKCSCGSNQGRLPCKCGKGEMMRKADEIIFYTALRELHGGPYNRNRYAEFASDVGIFFGLHPKRALYLLGKWSDKGWWDYGVSLRTGWFLPEAPEKLS